MTSRTTVQEVCHSRGRGIFLWIFCFALSIGLVMKLLPNLTTRVWASNINATSFENTNCREHVENPVCKAAQIQSGTWMSFSSGCAAVVTFFVTPMVGTLSDIYGRTRFLFLGTFFSLLPFCLLTFVYIFPSSALNTIHLFYYASIAGGGVTNFGLAVGLMYLADMFKPKHRAVVFALFLATVDLVLAGAPVLGVQLYKMNESIPWICATVCSVVTLLTVCCIPEAERYNGGDGNGVGNGVGNGNVDEDKSNSTLLVDVALDSSITAAPMSPRLTPWSPGSRSRVDCAKQDVNNCWHCKSCAFNPFKALKILNRSNFFRYLAIVSFFQNFVISGLNVISTYIQLYVLKMSLVEVGNANAIFALTGVFVQVALVQPLIKLVGLRKLMHTGNFALTVNMLMNLLIVWSLSVGVCHGASTSTDLDSNSSSDGVRRSDCTAHQIFTPRMSKSTASFLYILSNSICNSLAMMTFPAISALKTNEVSMDEQGGALGALWSARSLASSVSPFLFGWMWHRFDDDHVWLIYVVASVFAFTTFLSGFGVPKPSSNEFGNGNNNDNEGTCRSSNRRSGSDSETVAEVGVNNELSQPLL